MKKSLSLALTLVLLNLFLSFMVLQSIEPAHAIKKEHHRSSDNSSSGQGDNSSSGQGDNSSSGQGDNSSSGQGDTNISSTASVNYTLSSQTKSIITNAGNSSEAIIHINQTSSGTTETIGLSCAIYGPSNDVNCGINPSSIIPNATAILTINTHNETAIGNYTAIITGYSSDTCIIQKIFLPITVNPYPATTTENITLIDENKSAKGARVFLDGLLQGTMDEINGSTFTITNQEPGTHELKISKDGYQDYIENITVTAGKISSINIRLQTLQLSPNYNSTKAISQHPPNKNNNNTSAKIPSSPEVSNVTAANPKKEPFKVHIYLSTPPYTVSKTITFLVNKSQIADSRIKDYRWDFGDGEIGKGLNITHSYQNPGRYTIRLEALDQKQVIESQDAKPVTILPGESGQTPWDPFLVIIIVAAAAAIGVFVIILLRIKKRNSSRTNTSTGADEDGTRVY
jgi:PKD domain-containing protein/PEGA domain-containing protein